MSKHASFIGIVSMLVISSLAHGESRFRLDCALPAQRIVPDAGFQGESTARIACARGEYESFQIAVTAEEGPIFHVTAEASGLKTAEGATLDPSNVTLYRAVCVPLRHTAPRATNPPGWVADPLVPFRNPYTANPVCEPVWKEDGQQGPRFGAAKFEIWPGKTEIIWVDLFTPAETAPGTYTGSITLSGDGVKPVEVPIELTVWDFLLPPGPTHENHFGGFSSLAAYYHLDPKSEAFITLESRYAAMMAQNRLNPPLPAACRPAINEDGTATFDTALDEAITEFVNKHHVTNLEVPRAPFGDPAGADREKTLRYYRSWHAYLVQKGWAARAYVYMLDEPNDPDAYETVRRLGAVIKEAVPELRRLVVEQPYTQDPAWGVLDGAIDLWCPLFGFIHEPSVQRVIAQGDEVWSYTALVQTAPPYHPEAPAVKNDLPPFWELDFPLTSYRIAPWINRRYDVTGLLYWSSVYWGSPDRNPWDDPGFRIRWNGEGYLFYPGQDAGIEGPIASIRLKNLRDGMEDYEYFRLLEDRGGKEAVDAIVRKAVPTWGSWVSDPNVLDGLRRELAEAILARAPAQK